MKQDEYYKQAVVLAKETGYVSISMLQRKLVIGYNQSWKIVQEMEKESLIGPPTPGNNLRYLISQESKPPLVIIKNPVKSAWPCHQGKKCVCNKPTHTPGPWEIARQDDIFYLVIQKKKEGFIRICEVQQLINARLISAAPELLAKLKEALSVLEALQSKPETDPGFAYEEINSFWQVIAKAEGPGSNFGE